MTKPTSSSFDCEWTYDVFISFRGEDTRIGFTGHLYNAMCEKGIKTFFDDQELRAGEEITPALMEAIQESRIAIVIFSENYASSSFCLEELVNIMECIKNKGRLVWPVFYQVDPSHVRRQKGSYAEALAKHGSRINDKEKLKEWKSALQNASNLSGWHFKQGYEYELIGKIVQEVSKRVNRVPLYIAKHPVGLESRVQKVNLLLDVESNNGVHMVGIYGAGGIGKTTLACAVYNVIADQFESHCFLADVRENSMKDKHGLVQLQETLLINLLGEKDIRLGNVRSGIPIIKRRLGKKKILLILDDVDDLKQLEALAGALDWFGPGSRIIITTRNKHLLQAHDVERTYEVEGLSNLEALELLSWNAFKRKQVDSNYVDISERVALYSNGFPLYLEIIGSNLFGKTKSEWTSALETYGRIPNERIQGILKVSYDGLSEFEKEIFLDLACFFKGHNRDDIENILLNGRGSAPNYAIGVLIDRCLIKIDKNCVKMHDLIEEMGKEIVRQESPSKPGERSRLWFSEDILHVFKENKGSDKIEIIMLHLLKDKEVQWDGNALKKMENLKILVIKNAHFSAAPNNLPKSLRVLKWHGYPAPSLPTDFDPKDLVQLDLSMSSYTLGKQPIVKFKSLAELNLSNCQSLKQVPDLSGTPNLKKLLLYGCKNLVKVHDLVGFHEKLEYLDLSDCTSLRVLPSGINLVSLIGMSLDNCVSLKNFPEILGRMENIISLCLDGSGVTELPLSIGNLVGLNELTLNNCKGLRKLPSSIFVLPNLEVFQADYCEDLTVQIQKDQGLEQETMSSNGSFARFYHSKLRTDFVATLLPCLLRVTSLSLFESNIVVLPSLVTACISLRELDLDGCKELREIKGLPPNIEVFSATNCTSLNSKSKEMLLRKTLHETGGKHFCIPGSDIPTWFSHSSRRSSLSFWFRNKFPKILVCVAGVWCHYDHTSFYLIINGKLFTEITLSQYVIYPENHIIIFDLLPKLERNQLEEVNIENGWNQAEIDFWMGSRMKRSRLYGVGVHVYEEEQDVQFTNPNPTRRMDHFNEQ